MEIETKKRNQLLDTVKTPAIHSIHKGVVKRVLDFGSFVRVFYTIQFQYVDTRIFI